MRHSSLITTMLALAGFACGGDTTAPVPLSGVFTLIQENGQPLPADPFAPYGCCLTLSGSLTLSASTYGLITSHRNTNNGITFDNSEQGTYTRQNNTLTFTRTGGAGAGVPFLLGPGTASSDGVSVTLLYGDEGPGSNQIRGVFRRGDDGWARATKRMRIRHETGPIRRNNTLAPSQLSLRVSKDNTALAIQ